MKDEFTTHGLDIERIMDQAVAAAVAFRRFGQKETDRVVEAVFKAGFANRVRLAKLACKETKLGRWEDKVIKNVIATRFVYLDIKDQKTVGVIAKDPGQEIVEIAEPVGPIFAITPITNPTSTVLFKILVSMKSRNPPPHRSPPGGRHPVAAIARDPCPDPGVLRRAGFRTRHQALPPDQPPRRTGAHG